MSSENNKKKKDNLKAQQYALFFTAILLVIMIFATVILLVPAFYNFEPGGDVFSITKAQPGLRVGDDEGAWSHHTQVAVFRTQYVDGEMRVIASSSTGNNIIAPGTSNDYRFYLQNTSNTTIKFALNMFATITVKNYDGIISKIPVDVKLCRYDGVYLVGSENEWLPISDLGGDVDEGAISPKSYVYYTLSWKWDSKGNDELDSFLGSASANSSIELTLSIGASGGSASGNGTYSPIGERNGCAFCGAVCLCWLWIILIFVLLIGEIVTLIFLGKFMRKCKKYEDMLGIGEPPKQEPEAENAESAPETDEPTPEADNT